MLTFAEILALLARLVQAADPSLSAEDRAELVLTEDEQTALTAALYEPPADGADENAAQTLRVGAFTADEITELSGALHAVADAILDAGDGDEPRTPSDDDLATLEFVAVAAEACTAATAAEAEADQAARDRAQELAQRIRGQAGDDDGGEPGDADAGDAGAGDAGDGDADAGAGDGDAGAGDGADADEPTAVAASARVSRVAARRPAGTRPRRQSTGTTPLVASANVPGTTMGASLDQPEALGLAFAETLEAMGSMVMRDGMKIPLAHARLSFPAERRLGMNARDNQRMIDAALAVVRGVAASGGVDAPAVPRYEIPMFGTDVRPVRDSLTRFQSERGGSIIPSPIMLDDLDGAASIWTEAMDRAAATDSSIRKPCLRMEAGTDETVLPYWIVQCLEIGNWNARTWPERVTAFTTKANQWTARMAESRLLTRIGALSTQVTVPQLLGAARDVLRALDRSGAQMRSRHRLDPNQVLEWRAPHWLLDEIRSDLASEMPGSQDERLAMADAKIETFLAARRITPIWFLDGESGQVYGNQHDGALLGWKPTVVSYLCPAGTFILLDGGELNLGLVRDSTLNARNDFQMFMETGEEVAKIGPESLRLAMSLRPDGATAGTIEPTSNDVGNS
jgi:hypothetical protein